MEVAEVAAAESYYEITFTEEECRILTTDAALLDPLDRQRQYLLALALAGMKCPACLYVTCRRAAATDGLPFGTSAPTPDDAYACQRCGTRLVYHVALIGGEQFFTIHPSEARPPKEQS